MQPSIIITRPFARLASSIKGDTLSSLLIFAAIPLFSRYYPSRTPFSNAYYTIKAPRLVTLSPPSPRNGTAKMNLAASRYRPVGKTFFSTQRTQRRETQRFAKLLCVLRVRTLCVLRVKHTSPSVLLTPTADKLGSAQTLARRPLATSLCEATFGRVITSGSASPNLPFERFAFSGAFPLRLCFAL